MEILCKYYIMTKYLDNFTLLHLTLSYVLSRPLIVGVPSCLQIIIQILTHLFISFLLKPNIYIGWFSRRKSYLQRLRRKWFWFWIWHVFVTIFFFKFQSLFQIYSKNMGWAPSRASSAQYLRSRARARHRAPPPRRPPTEASARWIVGRYKVYARFYHLLRYRFTYSDWVWMNPKVDLLYLSLLSTV